MKFRKDINGLRAYAVLAVIIFHFNQQWLPGGFVGVDVFFVISGYLMTGIIFKGLNSNTFSLLKFYASRIKRIVPALVVLVIILIILGYFFLGPLSYRNLSKEAIRSLLFVSNFLYSRESGYFDTGAFSKPLLHTWSLSVEWQFYIIYPIILMIFTKFLPISALKKIVLLIATVSLGFTIYFSFKDPIASYFLLPTRIWEMLLGGLVFLYPLKLTKNWQKYSLECIGLILIIISFFIINENVPWPGYMALIPTLGSFILLQANGSSFLTNNITVQKIGLWSYSLYLYHWPLVYLNHRYNFQLNLWIFLTLTFLLALLSYYIVEKRRWKTKFVILITLISLIPIYSIYKTKGADFRVSGRHGLTAEQLYGGGMFPQYQEAYTPPATKTDFDYLIFGDSVSRQYAHYLLKHAISTRTLFADACLFTPNYSVYMNNQELEKCTQFKDLFYSTFIQESSDKPIIWAQNWDGYTIFAKDEPNKYQSIAINQTQYFATIKNEIEYVIQQNPNRRIYLIGVYVKPTYNVYECLSAQELSRFAEVCSEFLPNEELPMNNILKSIADQNPNIYFIDPSNSYCDTEKCRMIINDEPMFTDYLHLTTDGAEIVGPYIFNEIKKIESRRSVH